MNDEITGIIQVQSGLWRGHRIDLNIMILVFLIALSSKLNAHHRKFMILKVEKYTEFFTITIHRAQERRIWDAQLRRWALRGFLVKSTREADGREFEFDGA